MQRRANLGLQGHINIKTFNREGVLIDERDIQNTITDAGEDEAAKLFLGLTANPFTYIALGTDGTAASDAQTALLGEITTNGGARALDASPTTSGNQSIVSVTFYFTDALAIQETGLFNAATDGVMGARQVFAVINVGNGDSMTVTWTITNGTAR